MAKAKYEYWLTPEGLAKMSGWAKDGKTDEEIAKNMGITRSTLNEWKKKYSDISDTLKRDKEVADRLVEDSLYERALGGVREVKKTFKVKHTYYDEKGRKCEKEELKVGIDEVYIPGDTTAQIFWLKNRKPDVWRDKQSVELSGSLKAEKTKLDELINQMRGDNA